MWLKTVLLFSFTILINTTRPVFGQVVDTSGNAFWDLVQLNNSGQYSKAIWEAKKLLAHTPDFPGCYEQLAFAFIKAGKTQPGIAWFDSLRLVNPNNPYVYFANALFEKSRNKSDSAIENLKQCLKLNPGFSAAYLNLVEISNAAGLLAKTEKVIVSQIQADSLNAAAFYGLGCIYHLRNEYARGAAAFYNCLELNPELIHAYYLLGLMYEKQWDFPRAIKIWEKGREVAERKNELTSLALMTGYSAKAYHILGETKKAVSYGEEALNLARQIADEQMQAQLLGDLSESYRVVGRMEEAFKSIEQARGLNEKIRDPKFEHKLLGNLSALLLARGNPGEARKNSLNALNLARAQGDSNAVAIYSMRVGDSYWRQGSLAEADDFYRRSYRILQISGDKRNICTVLGKIATIYRDKGQISTAVDTFRLALQIARAIPSRPQELFLLGALGRAYAGWSNYSNAFECFNQAMHLADTLGDVSQKSIYTGNVGLVYMMWGSYTKSLSYINRALAIDRKLQNMDGVFRHLNNMAHIYEMRGDYVTALEMQKSAYAISDSLGLKHYSSAVLQNMGIVYKKIGAYDKALLYFDKALKLANEMHVKARDASLLLNIGTVYEKQRDYSTALEKYTESMEVANEIGDMLDQAAAHDAIGNVYTLQKQYLPASEHYKQALVFVKKIGQRNREGWLYHNLAKLQLDQGNLSVSHSLYQQALDVGNEMETFELKYMSLGGLAAVAEQQLQYKRAFNYYNNALDLIESTRKQLRIDSYKTAFMETMIPVYEGIIALMLRQKKFDKAYAYLQRFRARSFLEILAPDRIDITAGISPKLFAKYRKVEQNLRETYQMFGKEYKMDSNQKLITLLEDRLERARQEHQFVSDEIRLNHPRYAELTGMANPFTLTEIKNTVSQLKVSVVEYFVSSDLVAVWIIKPDGFHCQVLETSGAELKQMLEQLRQPFKDVKQQRVTNLAQVKFDVKLSRRLYERIFLPIEKYLSGNLPVIIVPDGVLHYLPFEALVTNIEKKRHDPRVLFSRYENAHYLLEKLPISYAPSVSILGKQRTSEVRPAGVKGELLAFGRPYFGSFGQVATKEVGVVAYSEKLMLKMSPELMFASLAEADVETVAEIMQPARIFLGHDATEGQFKKSASGFRHIYLSTHAVVDERQPMYSLVAFAQDDDPAEDGFLHAYEVFNLQLDADLVTLSACETGLGKLNRGEGIIGLTRAFLYAGAKSVLVSMWSVDESTSLLMKHFYQNLRKGQEMAQALRSAKLKLIKTRQRKMSFAHPFLWAPFVLVGQGQL